MNIAIVAITRNGARLGEMLLHGIPKSRLFVIEKHAAGAAHPFAGGLQALIDGLWPSYDGFVFVMATGIVVRTIAPLLESKDKDPAVVVMDDAGRYAVSLLSGHIGGANALAARCAAVAGSTPVITTATDVNNLPSFDMLAQEQGWTIDDLSRVKLLNALLLEDEEIAVVDPTGQVASHFSGKGRLSFHAGFEAALGCGASGYLFVTNRIVPLELSPDRLLILRPRNLYLGIGCNRGTSSAEIGAVVSEYLGRLSLSLKSVKCIGTAAAKGDEVGLREYAGHNDIPLVLFDSAQLNAVTVPSPASDHALAAIGAKGVAEPAALLASGGTLILNKIKSGNVTLAIAEQGYDSKRFNKDGQG